MKMENPKGRIVDIDPKKERYFLKKGFKTVKAKNETTKKTIQKTKRG